MRYPLFISKKIDQINSFREPWQMKLFLNIFGIMIAILFFNYTSAIVDWTMCQIQNKNILFVILIWIPAILLLIGFYIFYDRKILADRFLISLSTIACTYYLLVLSLAITYSFESKIIEHHTSFVQCYQNTFTWNYSQWTPQIIIITSFKFVACYELTITIIKLFQRLLSIALISKEYDKYWQYSFSFVYSNDWIFEPCIKNFNQFMFSILCQLIIVISFSCTTNYVTLMALSITIPIFYLCLPYLTRWAHNNMVVVTNNLSIR